MRFSVEYDNESDGEIVALEPTDVPILGVLPSRITHGSVAEYQFEPTVTEDDIFENLETSAWSFIGAQVIEDANAD